MRLITSLVLFCFSFVNLLTPAVVLAGTTSYKPIALPDSSSPTYNLGYEPSVPVLASTTWQKSYEQTVSTQASEIIRNIAAKNISALIGSCSNIKLGIYEACANPIKNGTLKVAIYLVPTYSFTPPTQALGAGGDPNTSIYYVYDSKNNRGTWLPYPSTPFLANNISDSSNSEGARKSINPSFATYSPTASNYGYFVGYAYYVYSNKGGAKVSPLNDATSTSIDPMGFAWLPLGTYKVYTAVGYAISTLNTAVKNAPMTLTSLSNNPGRVFPILTPEVAYSQLPSPISFKQILFTPKSEPRYPTSISPLPQSVSRNVLIPYNSTGKTISNALATENDLVLGVMSTSTVNITAAPNPEMIITSPFGDNIIWQKGVNQDVTWVANFKRSNDNDTGIHTWDGITVVRPYGYGITYNHGGTVDEYNSGGAVAGRIVLNFVPVVGQIIGVVLSILDLFGVFDDTTAPFAVSQVVTITQFSTSTNSYVGSPHLIANTYVENAKVTVSLANIPDGVYVLQAKALVGTTNVIATSSPFTLTSGSLVTTPIQNNSVTSTTTVATSTPRNNNPIHSSTTVMFPVGNNLPVASTTEHGFLSPVQNTPPHNSQNQPSSVSVPAIISGYSCPENYNLIQNNTCRMISNVNQTGHGYTKNNATTSGQMMIPATPIYTCPISFNLNTANNTCTKPVSYMIQDVPQESMMANVINTLGTMMSILSL